MAKDARRSTARGANGQSRDASGGRVVLTNRAESNEQWAARIVGPLPRPWQVTLLRRWEKRRSSFNPANATAEGTAQREANKELRASVAALAPVSETLPLDASDHDVCNAAWSMAEKCRVRLLAIEAEQKRASVAQMVDTLHAAGLTGAQIAALDTFEQRCQLTRICHAAGITAPAKECNDLPAVRRMVAAQWWTGRLRKAHAKAVESAAIDLALVARGRECYVSNVSLEARRAQNVRNAATLQETRAVNLDTEQEFTLAELAATGPGNKKNKRAELMTRINGFELIAIHNRHPGLFFTITCPSEMHRYTTAGRTKPVLNSRYAGIKPHQAQEHLSGVWARVRAKLDRHGVQLYGFRIAEPNHDGTPHWHCLMFHAPLWLDGWHAPLIYRGDRAALPRIAAVIRRYALAIPGDVMPKKKAIVAGLRARGWTIRQASADADAELHRLAVARRARENAQRGAKRKRVDFKPMDPSKGTAAGYIAKYVAKNIDGHALKSDLEGNDAAETSQRVEAWATRWGIRQFQQIGGPPVTVWRELRRVPSVPTDAPAFVRQAHNAVNRVAVLEGRDNASVAWNHYVEAQGGVGCGRGYRVRLATVPSDVPGRYGEVGAPRLVGINYHEQYKVRDAVGNWVDVRARTMTVESKRYQWEITRPTRSVAPRAGHAPHAAHGLDFGFKRAQRAPWTCVNNCTRSAPRRDEENPENERSRHEFEATAPPIDRRTD